jgi:hypothetical protein
MEIRLVAVSKRHGPDRVREAVDAGQTLFGENRVQEAQAKISRCPDGLQWHMIGHLQGNKARLAVRLFDMIHSVDSLKLLETLNRLCGEAGRTLPVLLEVNVSGEGVKYGLKPDETAHVLEQATRMTNLDVMGLMTMPPFSPDPEQARPHFRALRELRDRCREQTGFPLEELSMGMSIDFEVAIEEGATFVRIGTDLFGAREAK